MVLRGVAGGPVRWFLRGAAGGPAGTLLGGGGGDGVVGPARKAGLKAGWPTNRQARNQQTQSQQIS